jgi:phosphoglycolate phosphatase
MSRARARAIEGILFDKDGTLIDYARTWVPIHKEVALYAARGDAALAAELLRRHGQDPDTGDELASNSVLAAGSVYDIADAFAAHLGDRTPPDLAAAIDRIYSEGGARHAVPVDGAERTLTELKRRGFRLGVATNDSEGGLAASLARAGLVGHFDFAVGCDSGFGTKPDPRMVYAFCAAVGVDPGDVAVVGDAVHDLAMGRAAGVGLNVGVLGGTSAREDLAGTADLILAGIGELPTRPEFRRLG